MTVQGDERSDVKRSDEEAREEPAAPDEYFDVIIIGAGISGIDAAYRIRERNPQLSYTILERRERLGGTWDLFRYPGVRSDSDIFTLSLPFHPWSRPEAIADGDQIWEYLVETARAHRIDDHIQVNTHVRVVEWDSGSDTWTVHSQQNGPDKNGTDKTYRCRFVFFATGYYDYDHPYDPGFPGIESFQGVVAHPQHWPESLDCTGKRVVVIGSGATAISLVPAVAQRAAHVTMLQRSPTYLFSAQRVNPVANMVRKWLPGRLACWLVKWRYALFYVLVYQIAQNAPRLSKRFLRRTAVKNLPAGYDIDTHFKPRYNPWDQRLCLILDADLYKAVASDRADVFTDHIDHFDADGIVLRSGQRLDADVVITATGLQLLALGGVQIRVDGEKIEPHDRFVYKEHMLQDVPNMAWCIGYTNASWTLRADLTAQQVAKLLEFMTAHGYTHAYPHLGDTVMAEKPTWDLQAGYVKRAKHVLPKSGTRRPWKVRHNYLLDVVDHRFDRIEESMVFGRVVAGKKRSAA